VLNTSEMRRRAIAAFADLGIEPQDVTAPVGTMSGGQRQSVAVARAVVIITAGIDLPVGFVLVLSGVVAGEYYLSNGGPDAGLGTIWVGAILGVATGTAFGALQGVAVAKLKIAPLIATLMGLGVAEGLSYLITGGSDLRSVPNTLVSSIGEGRLGGVQWLIIISFLATIFFGLILAFTRFGRYTYAIGSNPEAAPRAGINVDWHLIEVYALSGLMGGLAGIVDLGYFSTTTISGHPLASSWVPRSTSTRSGGGSASAPRGLGALFATTQSPSIRRRIDISAFTSCLHCPGSGRHPRRRRLLEQPK
jgi:ribose transport system permease protein